MQLADGADYVFHVENTIHKSSCAESYYQCDLQSTRSNMLLQLLVQIIAEPCFNTLRTQEQLGYIVFSGIRRSNGTQGLRVIVQSNRHPEYVDKRIEAFLSQMENYIKNLPPDEFEKHKEALAAHILEKPKEMASLASKYWLEITSQMYNFDRSNIEVAFLKTLTKDDVMKFYEESIGVNAPKRHKLAVHVLSKAEGGAGHESAENEKQENNNDNKPVVIDNITKFKSMQSLFPLAQPFININCFGTKAKL